MLNLNSSVELICVSNSFSNVFFSDNKKDILFNNRFVFPSMPLLESGDYINTENYSNKYFKGPFSFFQLIETAPVVINRIQVLFNYYYEEWNKEIKYQSSTDVITNNSFFKSIIDLGSEVIPYIIEVLRDTPSFLIIALYKITGENPVKPDHCGKIKEMTKDWIEWWDKRYSAIG